MDPITKALQEVRFNVPEPILESTFLDPQLIQQGIPVSLDHRIKEDVIDARVRQDCNLTGAVQAEIPLRDLNPRHVHRGLVFEIPKSLTQGRTITSTLSVAYGEATGSHNAGGIYGAPKSALGSALQGVTSAASNPPSTSTARVQLIGENVIYVEERMAIPTDMWLRCMVTHDSLFSGLHPSSYLSFSNMVVLATKDHVYRTQLVNLGQGQLQFGQNLGVFREIIESYADASEMYYEYIREVWPRVASFSDETSRRRHLGMILGGGRI